MENHSLELTQISQNYLLETSKWAKFLSIISFISLGLIGLVGLVVTIMSAITNQIGLTIVGVIYLILPVLYFFPTFYLFRFSVRLKAAIEQSDAMVLEEGFENLKSLFKFVGVFTIVVLSMYVLAIIIAMIVGLMIQSY